MTEQQVEAQIGIGTQLSDKYLTFKLGEEQYGVQILIVQRIIQMQTITPVPRTPEYVRGVINLRGQIIPVIDIRNKFGMTTIDDTDTTCIVVIQLEINNAQITMGVIIDEVSEVLFIEADQIDETPKFGSGVDTDFIMGVAKVNDNVIMLLDITSVLSQSEFESLSKL